MLEDVWFWFTLPFKMAVCMAAFFAGCFVIGWAFNALVRASKKEARDAAD